MKMTAECRQRWRAVQMGLGNAIDEAIVANAEMSVQRKIEHGLLPFQRGGGFGHGSRCYCVRGISATGKAHQCFVQARSIVDPVLAERVATCMDRHA